LGSSVGEDQLLAAVTPDDPLVGVAVGVLVRVPSPRGTESILAALRACAVSNAETFDMLFQALLKLGIAIPEDTAARLRAAEPEWRRNALLKDIQ
jgi:hypothetical protein